MVEILIALCIAGVVTGVALLRAAPARDRWGVRGATTETLTTFAVARRWALSRGMRTAVLFDTARARLTVTSYADTIARRDLWRSHGVRLTVTRDSMAYTPNGLGYGASNLTLILSRGAVAETLVVSRLGRVRQ